MSQPYDQPTAAPTTKVASGALAGATTIILVFVIQSAFNVTIPAEVASAGTVIVSFLTSYFVREQK